MQLSLSDVFFFFINNVPFSASLSFKQGHWQIKWMKRKPSSQTFFDRGQLITFAIIIPSIWSEAALLTINYSLARMWIFLLASPKCYYFFFPLVANGQLPVIKAVGGRSKEYEEYECFELMDWHVPSGSIQTAQCRAPCLRNILITTWTLWFN